MRPAIRDYVLLWALLVGVGLVCRPLVPVDETRAVSVAWEMWLRGDPLVPHLNGETYSHKPPLLQWLIHLGWFLAGVNDWTPRLAAPLFGLGNLWLTARLARGLWPERPEIEKLAPLVLLSFPVWALWTTLTLYDMAVVFFTLVGMTGVLQAAQGRTRAGWLLTGLGIGGGVLSKGPVILVFILPVALLAPWWLASPPSRGWRAWYLGMVGAVLLGAALALAWAIPAGIAGGEGYRHAIFWGQSAGRIADSFAHRRPVWWYAAILPLLLFPWVLRLGFWKQRPWLAWRGDAGLRFCGLHAVTVLVLLSLISGKQVHYALPILPAAALIFARLTFSEPQEQTRWDLRWLGGVWLVIGVALWLPALTGFPGGEVGRFASAAPVAARLTLIALGAGLWLWRPQSTSTALRALAYSVVGFMVAAHVIYRAANYAHDDLKPMAQQLAAAQEHGATVAYWGKYSGDFQFLGRLRSPLQVVLDHKEFATWLAEHPQDCVLVVYHGTDSAPEAQAEFTQDYRASRRVGLWRAGVLARDTGFVAGLSR